MAQRSLAAEDLQYLRKEVEVLEGLVEDRWSSLWVSHMKEESIHKLTYMCIVCVLHECVMCVHVL